MSVSRETFEDAVALQYAAEIGREMMYIDKLFLFDFMQIEDPDAPGGLVDFNLWPDQRRILSEWDLARISVTLKARQLGISQTALGYSAIEMLLKPGYTVVALSKKDEDAKELVRRLDIMMGSLPPWVCMRKKDAPKGYPHQTWESTTHEVTIHHPDSEVISRFVAMPAAQDSGRSFTASLVILDEHAFQQWAVTIWDAAYPTVARPDGGKVIIISTAKRGTLFEEFFWQGWKNPDTSIFKALFIPWQARPDRTPQWYAGVKQAMAKDRKYMQEFPATPEEAFSAGEQTAFPEWEYSIHVVKTFTPPDRWHKWMSCDNGHADPFAWYWYCVDEDGQVYVYREYSRRRDDERVAYTDQAAEVMARSTHIDADGNTDIEAIGFVVAGLDAWSGHHRDQTGKDLTDYYREGGLTFPLVKTITDRALRKATVSEYLKPVYDEHTGKHLTKVKVMDCCTHLIETLPKLLNDEKDYEKVADSAIDNQYDSFGYGLLFRHHAATKPEETPQTRGARHKASLSVGKVKRLR